MTLQENCPLPPQELELFNLIKKDCKIIFDVGCREDVGYILNSDDSEREFHLFDPSPTFINSARTKLKVNPSLNHKIYLNNFGLGQQEGNLVYYPNTQSFVFRRFHVQSVPSSMSFPIKTIKSYCEQNSVTNIDFLKIDIEGMEIDCLLGGEEIINQTCKFVQFEFASTMIDRQILPEHLVQFFVKSFDLFLLRVDPGHPYSRFNKDLLTPLTKEIYQIIRNDMYQACGCNLVAIKKNISSRYR